MSKFAKVIQTVRREEKPERVRGKSRREDYSRLTVYIPKELHRQLRLKAVEEEREISELIVEALNRWFKGTPGV